LCSFDFPLRRAIAEGERKKKKKKKKKEKAQQGGIRYRELHGDLTQQRKP